MEYIVRTNRGFEFEFNSESFNPANYIEVLNNRNVLMVVLGTMVIQKNNIQSIAPKDAPEQEGTKLELHTSQGEIIPVYVDEYDASQMSVEFNELQKQFVLIGKVIVHKNNASLIIPAA